MKIMVFNRFCLVDCLTILFEIYFQIFIVGGGRALSRPDTLRGIPIPRRISKKEFPPTPTFFYEIAFSFSPLPAPTSFCFSFVPPMCYFLNKIMILFLRPCLRPLAFVFLFSP